jgi:aldose sugar dehydrogenase
MKKILIFSVAIILLILAGLGTYMYLGLGNSSTQLPQDTTNTIATNTPLTSQQPISTRPDTSVHVVAEGLNIPWDIAFLPDNEMLVTERPGHLVYFKTDGTKQNIPIINVRQTGESGLLGIVLHPDFAENRLLYLYITQASNGALTNRVERFSFNNGQLSDRKTIISGIPGAIYHDGGRMEFGPDEKLYITTGDATNENIAQNKNSLGGKLLRLNDDGSIPSDNPFGTAIYSYGHRNSQGLAWDDEGRLWSTEHGRSGVRSGYDEINLITMGANYGWPTIEGDATRSGMISPARHSGADDTWAPASALYWDGSLFFGGLRGEALFEAKLDGDKVVSLKKHFFKEYGRIRTVRIGPDGMFYITTSNRDARGDVNDGDDKLLKVNPARFRQ